MKNEEETYVAWDPISGKYVSIMNHPLNHQHYRWDKQSRRYVPSSVKVSSSHKGVRQATRRRNSKANRQQVARIAERDGWLCHWCGVGLGYDSSDETVEYPTRDHVVPWCETQDDSDENIVLACGPCNQRRGREDEIERQRKRRLGLGVFRPEAMED